KLTYYRKMIAVEGKLQGMLFEFISGIAKIRVAGAEKRVFSIWAEQFAKIKKLAFGAGKQQNKLEVFNNAYPILTNMLFFTFLYLFYMQTKEAGAARLPITVGAFMAFITAFRQFLYECLDMGYAIITSMYIIPMYERVKPLLEAEPESSLASEDPGVLRGEIEVSHLNFHYDKDSPLILKDVSVHIKAGEMVAFVGPSGSGKSTLMRILLGFEKPASGSVYYDGQDLSSLDVNLVRRQIGVVLQHGELMAGDIFSNIIGNANLSLEDAWEAARLAGLEEDIEQMPMGMHTVISEGAGTFSGGQRQRLMIARAIVHKPRILFMDEATSALDNRTQQIVTESLERLRATRIIIAHRLSTIMNADRIYVMEAGRVVQQGTYEELLQTEGVFKELAERQLV
ncbi:MAG: ATP-binding cassette domain-containing protein, partial [Chitinophagales bacterium]